MKTESFPLALVAREVPVHPVASLLPPALAARLQGRHKQRLGDRFGLTNFGVNLTRLAPGGQSSLLHAHARQDEFIYVLEGEPLLETSDGHVRLAPGMCAGFAAGTGRAHHLLNDTASDVWLLEVGDRTSGDEVTHPGEDLRGEFREGAWTFLHKDGRPYKGNSEES